MINHFLLVQQEQEKFVDYELLNIQPIQKKSNYNYFIYKKKNIVSWLYKPSLYL